MAKFKFSLEILLKVNNAKKKQVESEYAEAKKELDKQLEILSNLLNKCQELDAAMRRSAVEGTSINALKVYSSYFHAIQHQIKHQEQVVEQAERRLDGIKARLIGLIKELNVLNEIKERQYSATYPILCANRSFVINGITQAI